MKYKVFYLTCSLMLYGVLSRAQTGDNCISEGIWQMPNKLFERLNKSTRQMQEQMVQYTDKWLQKMQRREELLKKRLAKKDSAAAEQIFGKSQQFYGDLRKKMRDTTAGVSSVFSNVYSSKLDSLKTGLQFLQKNGLLQKDLPGGKSVGTIESGYNDLQTKFNRTQEIEKLLGSRQETLQQQLQHFNLPGFNELKKQCYYFRAQMTEYKKLWEDPSVLERRFTTLLCRMPEFKNFFDRYSDLGTVFQLPGNSTGPVGNNSLQTRDALNQVIQSNSTIGNIQGQIQSNLPASTGTLSDLFPLQLPDINSSHQSKMPDFKPNHQKVKSFLKRMEWGTSLQTSKANYFFPATTDISLSAGYRLNDKSIIGIGIGGKIGWGRGWKDISINGQGMSLRSFADVRLKGSWWITSGWEYHYQQSFSEIRALHAVSNWKQAGLAGITKVVPVKTQAFKKYRIQLLYDFLHRYKLPVTEPVKFRIGYAL